MPLVVLCGVPAAGKSRVAAALAAHLEEKQRGSVTWVTEESVHVDKLRGYDGAQVDSWQRGGGRLSRLRWTLEDRRTTGEDDAQRAAGRGGARAERGRRRAAGRAQLHQGRALRALLPSARREHDLLRGSCAWQ